MFATIGRLSDRLPPLRRSSIFATATASTRGVISPIMPGFSSPTPMAGFNGLYHPKRSPGPISEAACWSHGGRKFFVLADVAKSTPGKQHGAPLAVQATRRIDAIFAIESEIDGLPANQRLATRTTRIAPLVAELPAALAGCLLGKARVSIST
jgi:hypothetical protein